MTKPFTCSIKRIRFDENYEPANNTRLTTNLQIWRGESRQENLRRTLAMINNRFNSLASAITQKVIVIRLKSTLFLQKLILKEMAKLFHSLKC